MDDIRSDEASVPQPDETVVEVRESRLRLLGFLLLGIVFVAGCAAMALHPRPDRADATWGVLGVAFFGLFSLIFLRRLLATRYPSAILSAQGVARPGAYDGVLAWSSIEGCTLSAHGKTRALYVKPYPGAADHLSWKGLAALLLRLRGKAAPRQIAIPLLCSPAESDAFTHAFVDRLNAAKARGVVDAKWSMIDARNAEEAARAAAHEAHSEATAVFPLVTVGLIASLAIIFVAELSVSRAGTPSIATLVRLGGLLQPLVLNGDWLRLFTAPFLHAGVAHLLFNCLALWIVGARFERYVGAGWFAATFAGGALAGSGMSLALDPPNLVSVGASGGIVGLFAATALTSRHFPPGRMRTLMVNTSLQTLIPALLPLATAPGGGKIDYAAHFGGALGGAALGLALLNLWPQALTRPRFGEAAAAGAALFAVAGVGAIVLSVFSA
ncbi:MAG TPA: rhomboid family intramembrane serine protease [Methylocystis sp.]|nr:rhomboid family intramembrane serine protease [Methylocystis sp.]